MSKCYIISCLKVSLKIIKTKKSINHKTYTHRTWLADRTWREVAMGNTPKVNTSHWYQCLKPKYSYRFVPKYASLDLWILKCVGSIIKSHTQKWLKSVNMGLNWRDITKFSSIEHWYSRLIDSAEQPFVDLFQFDRAYVGFSLTNARMACEFLNNARWIIPKYV